MAGINYKKKFSHVDYIDNESVVKAGGEDGFNQKFHDLEAEFDAISDVVGKVDQAIDQVAAAGVPDNSVTTQKIVNNAVTPAKIPNKSLSADKLADGTLTLSKLKAGVFTGQTSIARSSEGEITISRTLETEGHVFLLVSVRPIGTTEDIQGPGGVEWKLQRRNDHNGHRHLLLVRNISQTTPVEIEFKIYMLSEL